jgi:hypothetical protein
LHNVLRVYFVLLPAAPPVLLPAEPAPEPVLLPEPMPELLPGVVEVLPGVDDVPPAPVLPEPMLGDDDAPPLEAPPDVLPAAPLVPPLVALSSRTHFSRSAPTMPRHFAGVAVVPLLLAPPEAEPLLVEPAAPLELEPVALGDELLELGDVVLEPVALGVEVLGDDEAPDEAEPPFDAPVALLLVSALGADEPADEAPVEELELCATATPEIASRAAAVAEQISFNVMDFLLHSGLMG